MLETKVELKSIRPGLVLPPPPGSGSQTQYASALTRAQPEGSRACVLPHSNRNAVALIGAASQTQWASAHCGCGSPCTRCCFSNAMGQRTLRLRLSMHSVLLLKRNGPAHCGSPYTRTREEPTPSLQHTHLACGDAFVAAGRPPQRSESRARQGTRLRLLSGCSSGFPRLCGQHCREHLHPRLPARLLRSRPVRG
jgi:hypothetical protein